MTERDWFHDLAESVGTMAHLPNNGAAYHTGEQIITHLNRVLGPGNWSFRILEQGQEPDSDEWWVFGELVAVVGTVACTKQDYGSQAMKRAKSTGKFLSKGEDRKAAATDALKRCARLLGVGLDAWANEKAPSWRPETAEEMPVCADCKADIAGATFNGARLSPADVAARSTKTYGRALCLTCSKEAKQATERATAAVNGAA